MNSEEVLNALNQWIADFGCFGCPSEIVSDDASYFLSEPIKSFGDFTGVLHTTIQPYSHEENGIVERANQEVIRQVFIDVISRYVQTYPLISVNSEEVLNLIDHHQQISVKFENY